MSDHATEDLEVQIDMQFELIQRLNKRAIKQHGRIEALIEASEEVLKHPMKLELDTLRETIDRIKKGEVA